MPPRRLILSDSTCHPSCTPAPPPPPSTIQKPRPSDQYSDATCLSSCAPAPPTPSGDGAAHHRRHLANILFISAAIAAAAFLLSFTYYAVLRRRRRPVGTVGGSSSVFDEPSVHHAWLVRTAGLDTATIEAIGVAEYKAGAGENDCAVCLAEFVDGEQVRLLPKCGHAFHVACIDPWLRAHVNCPLCRALIVDLAGEPIELGQDLGEITEMPLVETTVELGDENNQEELDNLMELGVIIEVREESESPPEGSTPSSSGVLSVVGSTEEMVGNAVVVVNEGAGSASEEGKALGCEDGNVGRSKVKTGNTGNTSKGGSDGKANSEMERSLSSSARGFFFSRH